MFVIATVCNKCHKFLGIPISDISQQWQYTMQYGRDFYIHLCDEHEKEHEAQSDIPR